MLIDHTAVLGQRHLHPLAMLFEEKPRALFISSNIGLPEPKVLHRGYDNETLEEFLGGRQVCFHKELLQVNQFKPPKVQQQAIQARLNYFLGADEYDRLFVAFEILRVENEVLTLGVLPACATEVRDKYSWHVAIVAEALLKQAIRKVNVIPLDESSPSQAQ